MNSQDKPIEVNDNLDQSLETSDAIEQEAENSVDLWSEENEDSETVTEFISAETAAKNDAEALEKIAPLDQEAQPIPKQDISLDLDDWDFRNPPELNPVESESNLELDDDSELIASSEEIDDFVPQQSPEEQWAAAESMTGENFASSLDLEMDSFVFNEPDDFGGSESINDESMAEIGLDNLDDLDEADLALDSSADLELNSLELNEPDDLGVVESLRNDSLTEISLDNSDDLDDLDEADLTLDSSVDLELDGLDRLSLGDGLDNLGTVGALEGLENQPIAEISLDNLDNLGEADLTVDSSADLELDGLDNLSLGDGLDGLDGLDNLDALDSLGTLEGLGDNELDSLLDLDITDSLDSLIIEPTSSLEESLGSLDSQLNETDLDLDSLLDEPAPTQTAPVSSTPVIAPSISVPQPAIAKTIAPAAPSPVKAQAFDQTMRVSVRKLDNLNNLIGELVVKRNRLEDDQERLRRFLDNLLGHVQSLGEAGAKMHDMYERSLLEGALMASRQSRANAAIGSGISGLVKEEPQEEGLDALEMDRFTGFHLLSQDIIELIVRVREAASDIQFVVDETDKVAQTFRQVTSQLQDGMNSSRMVAFGQAADRLPRAIRDISRKQKKQTKLHVEGEDVLIDKMIVEHLYNPMTHLVNNAISHGIEKPEERRKQGKSEVGNIYIRAFLQGNQTVITVKDDGAGIDPEKVKEKAIEKNLITWATAQNLSDQQVYELLFHPGFSTKDQADDFSGRGVGMDVVNTDLKKIRGSISTESEIGKGTTFTVRLPLVLSICKALTCVDNNSKISFPIDGVENTQEYLPSDIQTNVNGVRCISWKDTLLPLRPLSSLLNYNRQIGRAGIYNAHQNKDDIVSVVILRSLDHLLAIEVDEIKTEQEIVIKQIDGPIAKPPGIAGATVLGDGTIMPIGDVLELIEIAQGKRTIEIGFNILAGEGEVKQAQSESIQQEPLVLVVDDSITVRELLTMSFNKLGYRVEQARDGQEAWDKLQGGLVCDMIFSDIEMPRMNGLEFLSNLHQDSTLKSIPVAMLTSRGADKHRQIASDLGAKAYLTKPYTEKDLMDVAQHLIEINRANKEAESAKINLNRVKSETDFKDAPLVLIIDDSVTVRELLSMSFKKAGYRVEQARDGQEAWEKLRDGLECDIAFCDIEMPRMNGLELLSQLQKDEKLATLPIAMLTSRGAQKMRNIAASRGANGYFVKPYVEDDLLKAAQRMMNGEMLIEDTEG